MLATVTEVNVSSSSGGLRKFLPGNVGRCIRAGQSEHCPTSMVGLTGRFEEICFLNKSSRVLSEDSGQCPLCMVVGSSHIPNP